ncbi:MAG: OmpA family protein [Bacteroidota bacterium]
MKHLVWIFSITITVFLTSNTIAQTQTKENIYFEHDAFKLVDSVKKRLDIVAKSILLSGLQTATVSGYTDEDGGDEYNNTLSKKRADAVGDYLLSKGVAKEKLEVKYFGKTMNTPSASDTADTQKKLNRRVEVAFNGVIILGNPHFGGKTQFHTIQAIRDNTFKLREGTKITIPKNAFKLSDGSVYTGALELEMAEFYKRSDMIKNKLATTSDRQLLESAGMFYINPSDGNKVQVHFDAAATMTVQFAGIRKDSMDVFIGDLSDGKLNWIPYVPKSVQTVPEINSSTNINKLNEVTFKGGQFGWINCDKFLKFNQKTGLYVNVNDTTDLSICLGFKKYNSLMDYGNRNQGVNYTFYNVPIGEEATIIAFKMVGDKVYCVFKDLVISEQSTENLSLAPMTKLDFDRRLNLFNMKKP